MEMYPGQRKRHYVIHCDMITNAMARQATKYEIGLSLQSAIGALIYEVNTVAIGKGASRIYGLREVWDAGMRAAGIGVQKAFLETSSSFVDDYMDINFKGI